MRRLEGFADLGGAGQIRLRIAAGLRYQSEHRLSQRTSTGSPILLICINQERLVEL